MSNLRKSISCISIFVLFLIVTTGISLAATHTVTNTDDAGPGSLRQIIEDSSIDDVIVFDGILAGRTIFLTTGQITIDHSIDITGPGPDLLTIDGSDNDRIFFIFSDPMDIDVMISGLTLTNGNYGLDGTQSRGGCIYNNLESLTVENTIIKGCETVGRGGGIYSRGVLTIIDSTISDNHANISGGGIFSSPFMIADRLTIDRSTISGNTVNTGSGGGISSSDNLFMTNSTVSGNMATNSGGGTGGVSTGGINNQISSSTIVDNQNVVAAGPGGLSIAGDVIGFVRGELDLKNTIIAGNTGANTENNCHEDFADITDLGGNISDLAGPGECNFAYDPDFDFLSMVGPLQDNGGPTETHALLPVPLNAAIDGVTDCTFADGDPVNVDQRLFPRPFGSACDIGAFELQGMNITLNTISPGMSGIINEITAENATADRNVAFVWGFFPGTLIIGGQTCNGLELDIKNPRLLRIVSADFNGIAEHQFFIPLVGNVVVILTQAIDIASCVSSEVVSNIIQN